MTFAPAVGLPVRDWVKRGTGRTSIFRPRGSRIGIKEVMLPAPVPPLMRPPVLVTARRHIDEGHRRLNPATSRPLHGSSRFSVVLHGRTPASGPVRVCPPRALVATLPDRSCVVADNPTCAPAPLIATSMRASSSSASSPASAKGQSVPLRRVGPSLAVLQIWKPWS